jgi:hypothetical protein
MSGFIFLSEAGCTSPTVAPVTCEARPFWAEAVIWMSWSTIEYEPTDFVAQLLIVKHEITDLARKLGALPFALQATSFFSLTVKRRLACGFDCIGGCA